jgi:hypothetical protein
VEPTSTTTATSTTSMDEGAGTDEGEQPSTSGPPTTDFVPTSDDPNGLPEVSRSFALTVADFNGDGRDDVQLSRHQNRKFAFDDQDGIWLWTESGYELSFPLPPFRDRHGCAAGDVDGDGLVDLFCQLGAFSGGGIDVETGEIKAKSNELWLQQADGRFVDVAEAWGVTDQFGRGRHPLLLDFDGDGRLDLYATNVAGREDGLRSENIMYRNLGDRFVEVDIGVQVDASRCVTAADFDRDDRVDIVLCTELGEPVFLVNGGDGSFREVAASVIAREGERAWQDVAFGDMDGDGLDDLVIVKKTRVDVRYNTGDPDAPYTELGHRVLLEDVAVDVVVGQFTGDEALDIFVVRQGEECTDLTKAKINERDIIMIGPELEPLTMELENTGCGDVAAVVDEHLILVLNGAEFTRGKIQLLDLR